MTMNQRLGNKMHPVTLRGIIPPYQAEGMKRRKAGPKKRAAKNNAIRVVIDTKERCRDCAPRAGAGLPIVALQGRASSTNDNKSKA
jgi:hypothetical protein